MDNDILSCFLGGLNLRRESAASWCGPCPQCGGTDRFVVWPGDRGRGRVTGRFHCRQCGIKGDALTYLMDVEGMSFSDAAHAVNHDTSFRSKMFTSSCRSSFKASGFTPKATSSAPQGRWQKMATRIVRFAQAGLGHPDALTELHRRFLTIEQAKEMRLGWLARDIWLLPSKDLGLEPKYKDDGKTEKKTCLPAGLVIPVFTPTGEIAAVEVRRKRGTEEPFGKYAYLRGGGGHYMAGVRGLPVVVAESKVDCMRLHNVCGVGVLAIPANHKPTASEYDFLQAAACVIVSLDNDIAGNKARNWWLDGNLPRARSAKPVNKTDVKNFGELPDAELWEWITAEIENAAGDFQLEQQTHTPTPPSGSPTWPGVHVGGNPCCEWLPTIERECLGGARFIDWEGYGFPSTGVPLSLQGVASCGWTVVPAHDGSLQLIAGRGRKHGKLRAVCENWLAQNGETIRQELGQWSVYENALR